MFPLSLLTHFQAVDIFQFQDVVARWWLLKPVACVFIFYLFIKF